jgi:hypothetical protein
MQSLILDIAGAGNGFAPNLAISATRLSNCCRRRAATTTLAPSAANSLAAARPMPELAPVTMATLFASAAILSSII